MKRTLLIIAAMVVALVVFVAVTSQPTYMDRYKKALDECGPIVERQQPADQPPNTIKIQHDLDTCAKTRMTAP